MNEAQAIRIASEHAEQRGWPWVEPVDCRRRSRWLRNPVYLIRTNADKRGANVVITIDAVDGTIVDAKFLGR